MIQYGFGRLNPDAAAETVTHSGFNRGNIHDPYQLIQGKVSGLLIARAGNDPNEPFSARIRGVNSVFLSNSPLVIVDGMPYSSLLNVDPFDIASITVIKDAATAAQFGINSQAGVILIETRGAEGGLSIRHYTAYETPDTGSEMLNSADYVAVGGPNLGNPINWRDEITRNALTHATHIAWGGKEKRVTYATSFNYRNAKGVLEGSGFNNYNGRGTLAHDFLEGRLKLEGNAAVTRRDNFFSFREAFKYAKTFNPTSAVTFDDGNYREYLIFDNYNPAAMVRQNINDGVTRLSRLGANVSFDITGDLAMKGGYSFESQKNQNRRYWSKTSVWEGRFANGSREEELHTLKSNFGFAALAFNRSVRRSTIYMNGSVSFQNLDFNESLLRARDFRTDAEGSEDISALNLFDNGAYHSIEDYYKNLGITSYRGSFSWNSAGRLFVDANLSHERYSDHIKGSALGLSAGFDFAENGGNTFTQFKPSVSFGRSAGALAFFQNYNPRDIIQSWRSISNYRISPERKSEFVAGLDLALRKLRGSINFFTSDTRSVLVHKAEYDPDQGTFMPSIVNEAGIHNSGIEIDLQWALIDNSNLSLQTSLNFTTIKNKFKTDRELEDFQPLEFIVGRGATNFYALENNKPIGQFLGYAYAGIVDNRWVFEDLDGNTFLTYDDLTTFGQPLPSSFMGWTTNVKAGRWAGSLFFRGAFGHHVLNSTRLGFENPFFIPTYNATASVREEPLSELEDVNYPSGFYLENATYFTLDNVGISYELFNARRKQFSCRLSLTAQHVFVLSGYSGTSPEVRLDYLGNSYAAGFDSQFTYANSRTVLVGLHFTM